ncbi:hypothetical protein M3Y96_01212500 [Aphelenchoides besseyi]|nr:hypothetical protein M3Y96_01212500 [Aphelenchoides besseyi]
MLVFDWISSFGCMYSSLLCSYVDDCFRPGAPSHQWEFCHFQSLMLLFFTAFVVSSWMLLIITFLCRNFDELSSEYKENVEFATSNSKDEIQPKKSSVHNVLSAAGDVLFNFETSSDKKND